MEKNTFEMLRAFTARKVKYENGSRNNHIYQLACNCNRHGIPLEESLQMIIQSYDLGSEEITRTVRSAYKNKHEFNTKQLFNYLNSKS
jgi:hypothetical protein